MALSNNEILNLTDLYIVQYELEKEKHFDNLKPIFINHGNKPFCFSLHFVCKKLFTIIEKWNVYHQSSLKREHMFLDKLQKACYIQVKKRRVVKEPINSEFNDEVVFTINVFI